MGRLKVISQFVAVVCLLLVGCTQNMSSSDLTIQKSSSDNSIPYYGVRWSVSNPHDLGERCFGSTPLKASIGIGPLDGYSDFDNIYPWSDIKRCNVTIDEDGVKKVIYEGQKDFSLTGSNGDVFVRIPKFRISRYIENGFEYRVIDDPDGSIHEAFIENGEEIDEIFIGAFESYLENDRLCSKAQVIPTSNVTAQIFLDAAQNKGKQFSLYDNRCVDAIWSLMVVEYGKRNTNQILGYGLADFLQPIAENKAIQSTGPTNVVKVRLFDEDAEQMPVGSTITICEGAQTNIIAQRTILSVLKVDEHYEFAFDGDPISISADCFVGSGAFKTNFCESVESGALNWHTGISTWNNHKTTRNPVRYRWIENIVGNLWHFLPDVTFCDGQMFYCPNMENYCFGNHDGSEYYPVGEPFLENNDNGDKNDIKNRNYWITDLADEPTAMPVLFARNYNKKLTSSDAFGAYYYLNASGIVFITNGGGFDHLWRCNMLTNRAWNTTVTRWYLYGARLIFKDIL